MTDTLKRYNKLFILFIIFAWLTLLLQNPLLNILNKVFVDQKSLFVVNIEIELNEEKEEEEEEEEKPLIHYTRIIQIPLKGTWFAIVQEQHEDRFVNVCSGQGDWEYLPSQSGKNILSWKNFLGKDCDIPKVAYRLQTYYHLSANNNFRNTYGPFFSNVITP